MCIDIKKSRSIDLPEFGGGVWLPQLDAGRSGVFALMIYIFCISKFGRFCILIAKILQVNRATPYGGATTVLSFSLSFMYSTC